MLYDTLDSLSILIILSSLAEVFHALFFAREVSVHADRTPGGDSDHRHSHCLAGPGSAKGPSRGGADPVHQQPEADRPGHAELSRGLQGTAPRLVEPVLSGDLHRPG